MAGSLRRQPNVVDSGSEPGAPIPGRTRQRLRHAFLLPRPKALTRQPILLPGRGQLLPAVAERESALGIAVGIQKLRKTGHSARR